MRMMELREETKRGIKRITGLDFSELLEKKPAKDPRLALLRGGRAAPVPDSLVRGNPELTMGYVTTMEEVDAYLDKKTKERRDEIERGGGTNPQKLEDRCG